MTTFKKRHLKLAHVLCNFHYLSPILNLSPTITTIPPSSHLLLEDRILQYFFPPIPSAAGLAQSNGSLLFRKGASLMAVFTAMFWGASNDWRELSISLCVCVCVCVCVTVQSIHVCTCTCTKPTITNAHTHVHYHKYMHNTIKNYNVHVHIPHAQLICSCEEHAHTLASYPGPSQKEPGKEASTYISTFMIAERESHSS